MLLKPKQCHNFESGNVHYILLFCLLGCQRLEVQIPSMIEIYFKISIPLVANFAIKGVQLLTVGLLLQ